MRQEATMSSLPSLTVSTIVSADYSRKSIHCPVTIRGNRTIVTTALLDTGAGGAFIDSKFAISNRIALKPLLCPLPVYNVDQTPNKNGRITHFTWLDLVVSGTIIPTRLYATNLGGEALILGLPWLKRVGMNVDLKKGTLEFDPDQIQPEPSLL